MLNSSIFEYHQAISVPTLSWSKNLHKEKVKELDRLIQDYEDKKLDPFLLQCEKDRQNEMVSYINQAQSLAMADYGSRVLTH